MNDENPKQYLGDNLSELPANGGTQEVFYSTGGICPRPTMVKGQGIYLWDDKGNQYIDASSGPVTCNLGHANHRVLDAINKQSHQLSFSFPSTARNEPNEKLAAQLTTLAGTGFERAMFVSGGSEAVDMAIKFCRQYRFATGDLKRNKLISCQPSYHGMTLGALAVLGDPIYEEIYGEMISIGEKIPAYLYYRNGQGKTEDEYANECAVKLEEKILAMGKDTVLAFIVEPVGGSASGAIAPPESYFNEIRRICDQYGVFLIYDEVMSGIGRTGTFLTSHLWPNAKPDISVVAKGLGAGYLPLGAMLTSASLVEELSQLTGFNYAYTYNASPLACAVGSAVLDEITENNLLGNCVRLGKYLKSELKEMQQDSLIIGDIRGRGLLLGIELVACKKTRKSLPLEINAVEKIRLLGQDNGLMIYGRRSNNGKYGDNILIAPPLNITEKEIRLLIQRLKIVLKKFENELKLAKII
jgi:adenosylmethionine-8-amino-7-oxononanoate aminotransferase